MLQSFRLPFRDDTSFSLCTLLFLILPLAFTLATYEHYEVVKFTILLILLGWVMLSMMLIKNPHPEAEAGMGSLIFPKAAKIMVVMLGCFWAWSAVSTLFSLDRSNSLFGFYPRMTSGLLFYTVWTLLLVVLLFILNREKAKFLFQVTIVSAFVVAIVGILQSYGVAFYQGLSDQPFQRAPSLLGNPNFSSMFTAMAAPAVVILFARVKSLWLKVYYGAVLCAIIFSTILLSSRGALLALYGGLLAVAIVLLPSFKKEKITVFLIVLTMASTVLIQSLFYQISRPGTAATTIQLTETNVQLRLLTWFTSYKAIIQRPWLGSGPGNFHIAFERARDNTLSAQGGIFDDAHNIFITLAVTGGVPIAVIFASLLFFTLWVGGWKYRDISEDTMLMGVGGIVAFIIAACFNPVVIPCFAFLALCIAAVWVGKYGYFTAPPLRPFFTWSAGLLAVAFIGYGAVLISSEFLFFKGYQEFKFARRSDVGLRYINKAIALNPVNPMFYSYRTLAAINAEPDIQKIIRFIESDRALNPTTTFNYSRAATNYFLLYKRTGVREYFDLAIKNMTQSFKWDPYYAARYGRLGYFYFLNGNLVTAKEESKVALTLDPNYLPARLLLARIYQIQNRPKEVYVELTKAYETRTDLEELLHLVKYSKDPNNVKFLTIPLVPQIEE